MGWFSDNPSNVSSGGHVYDRTTGSWAGETQGSAGDGVDRSIAASEVKIWRDANGITGYDVKTPQATQAPQAPQGAGAGAAPVAATAGAGAPPAAGQAVGAAGATMGPGSAGVVTTGIRLTPKMKKTGSQLVYGGKAVVPHPGFSDMDEVEQRLGDGDSPLDPAWYYKWSTWAADTYHNNVDLVPKQTQFQPGGGQWITEEIGNWWDSANSPFGPDKPVWGFDSGGF